MQRQLIINCLFIGFINTFFQNRTFVIVTWPKMKMSDKPINEFDTKDLRCGQEGHNCLTFRGLENPRTVQYSQPNSHHDQQTKNETFY